jgi:hypothetical protein
MTMEEDEEKQDFDSKDGQTQGRPLSARDEYVG